MIACAQWLGRTSATCTRGDGCICKREEKMDNCIVCDQKPAWAWTDTHGIAQCIHCGTPYRIFHYEGEGENSKRVDKAPACVVLPAWVPLLRRYREETKHMIPGGHSFSPDYEVAKPDDFEAFNSWCNRNRAEIDKAKQEAIREPA